MLSAGTNAAIGCWCEFGVRSCKKGRKLIVKYSKVGLRNGEILKSIKSYKKFRKYKAVSPKPSAEGSSPSAPATSEQALLAPIFCVSTKNQSPASLLLLFPKKSFDFLGALP